jgi:hypothetical protein
MNKLSQQSKREIQKKKKKARNALVYGGSAIGVLAVVILIIIAAINSNKLGGLMGDPVAITSSDHVPSDAPAGPYNSNPPAGGKHYETDFTEKFYQEADLATLPKYPEGYLVHSLEHGYVIFWYNCQISGTDCTALKKTIQNVMDQTGNTKLIAFPWTTMDVPLAMTSWGRILNFTEPDPVLMKKFVERNRYQAPEPNAP